MRGWLLGACSVRNVRHAFFIRGCVVFAAALFFGVETGRCATARDPVDASEPEVVPVHSCIGCRAPSQCFEFFGGPADNRDVQYQCCPAGTVATGESDPRKQRCAVPEVRGQCNDNPRRGPVTTVTYCPGIPPMKVCCPALSYRRRQVRATCDSSPTAQQCKEINLDEDGEIPEEDPVSAVE